MKSAILFSMMALALSASAYGQHPPASRFGVIEIKDDDQFSHRLLLNGKEIFQYEGLSIELFDVLKGRGLDYLIVKTNSGGIACPFQVVIIELYKSHEYKVCEEFGSCGEPSAARLINGRVIVETPMYPGAHPELLSKQEARRRERTKEVYTWYRGKLTKRVAPL